MALSFSALHRAPKPDLLNEEWFVLENTGPGPLHSAGWAIAVGTGRGGRARTLGTLQPGFLLAAGEKVRIVTGTASKRAQGTPPADDGIKNYHLFLREPLLRAPGTVVQVMLNQLEMARATFDPDAQDGIAR